MEKQTLFQGLGTAESPYLICNEEDLFALANAINNQPEGYKVYTDKHFLLINDIQLKRSWTPIGYQYGGYTTAIQRYTGGFCGIFNGGGHLVSQMDINADNIPFVGLFGLVQGTIRNLGVEGRISVTGGAPTVGGLAGLMHQSLIENCYSAIDIQGIGLKDYPNAGGVIGKSQNTPIINCYAHGRITMKGGRPVVGCIASDDQPGTVAYWCKDMQLEARDSENKELAIRISGVGIDRKVMTGTHEKVEGTNQTFLELLNSKVNGEMIRWTQENGQFPGFEKVNKVVDIDISNANDWVQVTSEGIYRISGSSAHYGINVHPNLTVTIILDNAEIRTNFPIGGPFNISEGSDVTVELRGKNILQGGQEMAGIIVRANATLTIQGDGSLEAYGGEGASGIGCGYATIGGDINIKSGTIFAKASQMGTWRCHASGIGGGGDYKNPSSIGNINISGGKVTAEGDPGFFGVGPGKHGKCGKITIAEGTITSGTTVYGNW